MKKRKTVKRTGLPKAPPPIHTMGVVLPRNALNKELVHQHVVATQEYDHRRAELIANFIVDLGNLYKETQPKKMSYLRKAAEQLYDLDDKLGRGILGDETGLIRAELCEIRLLLNAAINTNEKN